MIEDDADSLRQIFDKWMLPSKAAEKASRLLAQRKRDGFCTIVPAQLPIVTPANQRFMEGATEEEVEALTRIEHQRTVLCQTVMPYRAQAGETQCQQSSGCVHVLLSAGTRYDKQQETEVELSPPHGIKGRLVLMHLHGEAWRTGNPMIHLGERLDAFIERITGHRPSARERAALLDQVRAMAESRIYMAIATTREDIPIRQQANVSIISGMYGQKAKDDAFRIETPEFIRLDDIYFEYLAKHSVPLDEGAIRALRHSATALDLYTWIAHRVHRVPPWREARFSWQELREQCSARYARLADFKRFFRRHFRAVQAVYPEANATLDPREGLTLRHSPPPTVPPSASTNIEELLPLPTRHESEGLNREKTSQRPDTR